MSKIIQIKNQILPGIPVIIGTLVLEEKQSSGRRRFLRDLKPFIQDLDEARKEIQEKYAIKTDDGNIKLKENVVQYSPENRKKSNDAWNKLNEEFITIDVTAANEKDLLTVKDILKAEQKRFIEEKKNKFNADDFEYSSLLEEITIAITPVEAKKKKDVK